MSISWPGFLLSRYTLYPEMELAPVCIFVAAVLLTPQPWQTAVIQALLRELSLPVILSACIPFLALATIAEAGCSARFGMEELELSSRFSLQAVLCARLGILNGESRLSGSRSGYPRTHSRSTSLLRNCGSTGTQKIYQTIGGINIELHIDRLSKHYKNKIAADRISLSLEKGVHGLPGANGAGKTTLLRMICGILRPDSGTVTLGRADVSTEEYRSILGYLPQDFGYYPSFTAEDFLMHMAALKELRKTDTRCCTGELLSIVGLEAHKKQKIKTFSGGMKRRLGIAQALLNRPRLLVLDEPTAVLEPKERVRFREMVDRLGQESIVLLSLHIKSDIELIADRILILKDGRLIFNGTHEDIGEIWKNFIWNSLTVGRSGLSPTPI